MTVLDATPLINALLHDFGIKSDSKLCERLGIAPPQISKMRKKKTSLNDEFRVLVMREFGLTLDRIDELVPPVKREPPKWNKRKAGTA